MSACVGGAGSRNAGSSRCSSVVSGSAGGAGFRDLGRAGAESESVGVLAPPRQPLRQPIAPGSG